MVEIIGLGMIGTLILLVSWAMAGESNTEQWRIASAAKMNQSAATDLTPTRQAA